jgi:hypothetical protein
MTHLLSKYGQGMHTSLSTFELVEINIHTACYHCAICSTWNIVCTNLLPPQMYGENAKHTCWRDSRFYRPCCSWNPVYLEQHPQTMYMPYQLHLLIHHCKCALCIFSPITNHIHSTSNWMVTSIPWILLDITNIRASHNKFLNVRDAKWAQKNIRNLRSLQLC